MGLLLSDLRVVSFVLLLGSIVPAQAEVSTCKEITALPATINAIGVWCLKKSLSWTGTTGAAIEVQAHAVTIDLNGFTITGSLSASTQAVGIHSLSRRNVTIRNGTLRGFFVGISLEGTGSINDVIEDMHVDQPRNGGILIQQATGTVVRNNHVTAAGTASGNSNFGIAVFSAAKSTTISNNVINGLSSSASGAAIITTSDLTEIRDNSVLNVVGGPGTVGIETNNAGTNATIQNNRVLNGATAGSFGILANGAGNNCINNVVHQFATPISGCTFSSGNLTPP